MKPVFFIAFYFFTASLFAQERAIFLDSTNVLLQNTVAKTDSVNEVLQGAFESDKLWHLNIGDSIEHSFTHSALSQRVDSLKPVIESFTQKIQITNELTDSLLILLNTSRDSIGIGRITQKVDSLQRELRESIALIQSDTLMKKLEENKVMEKYLRSRNKYASIMDSLNLKTASLTNLNPKANTITLPQLPGIGDKLPDMNPAIAIPDAMLPALTPDIPEFQIARVTELTKLENPVSSTLPQSTDTNGLAEQLADVISPRRIADLDNLQGTQEQISSINVSTLEEKVATATPIQSEIQAATERQADLKSKVEQVRGYSNPDQYKQQMLSRARQTVNMQLALHQKEIEQAVGKVSKYEKQLGTVLNLKNPLSQKRDPVRKLKPHERIIPSLTLQVQKGNLWQVDINPALAYQITSYWNIGTGWVQRFIIDHRSVSVNYQELFGIRTFTDVIIFKGMSARIEGERLTCFSERAKQLTDNGVGIAVVNFAGGLKKQFRFAGKVNGHTMFLYQLASTRELNVYPTRFNVRFGFEFTSRKKHASTKKN